jgi:hypothetical protein
LIKVVSINPIAEFNLEDNSHQFEIVSPGYYSISILGAGFIRELQSVSSRLTLNNLYDLEVCVHKLAPRFTKDNRIGIEYWGFSTNGIGRCMITLSNVQYIQAYGSMLNSKRVFESAVEHSRLKVIIHPSIRPVYKFLSIVSLILGVGLVLSGIILGLDIPMQT